MARKQQAGKFTEDKKIMFNILDKISIETLMKYVSQGAELVINDGHVQAMILNRTNEAAGEEAKE